MDRFVSASLETAPAASSEAATAPRRRDRTLVFEPPNQLSSQSFPSWARLSPRGERDGGAFTEAVFSAGASLAVFDAILQGDPRFAGALRQRLALRAGANCASMLRLREDEGALRDAEHLAPAQTQTSPAGRLHRLWRSFASRPARLNEERLRAAAELLNVEQAIDAETFVGSLEDLERENRNPLALAALAASFTIGALPDAPRADAEVLALWAADLVLARLLGWGRAVPLLATKILDPSLRVGPAGKRPRPGDPDWPEAAAHAYALAARNAHALAADLARRSERSLAALPKLRAKGAGRVIELLLSDDAVSPANAAKAAGLSDRASRRLFDRLIELGAVRELTGRPNFRLYGL
jgi:hypothetical protein